MKGESREHPQVTPVVDGADKEEEIGQSTAVRTERDAAVDATQRH